jgi:hypothetical protein
MALLPLRLEDGQSLAQQAHASLEELPEQFVHADAERPGVRPARMLGLHDDLHGYWMADDFDAELSESFWLSPDN